MMPRCLLNLFCGVLLWLAAMSTAQAAMLAQRPLIPAMPLGVQASRAKPGEPISKQAAMLPKVGSIPSLPKGDRAHVVQSTGSQKADFKEDELIIKYKSTSMDEFTSDSARSHRQALHSKHKAHKIKEYRHNRMEHVRLQKGTNLDDAILSYKQDSSVEYVERNYIRTTLGNVNDILFPQQWDFNNTGQTGGKVGADIKMPLAWDISKGSKDVVVMVIDTGIDNTHEDLAANVWVNPFEVAGDGTDNDGNWHIDDIHGIDPVNGDSDPMDDNGHGTHVAGTIGAVGNNLLGVSGINQNIQVIGCKFLDMYGNGFDDGAIFCLDYALDLKGRGVNIVATNNSWGGGSYSWALENAIKTQGDILFIAAAGNDGANIDQTRSYPAKYSLANMISVAATNNNDIKASWSNYGRNTVDIGAPGVDIVSLRATGTDMYGDGLHMVPNGDPNAKYYRASGTSMAAPHVTGLAALIKAWNPALSAQAIKNLIISGADPLDSLESSSRTGRRINAYGSLSCVSRPVIAFSGFLYTGDLASTDAFPILKDQNTTFSVMSMNCQNAVGPVTVTASNGESFALLDNGVFPDQVAGDGIFTGTFINNNDLPVETMTISSPAGTVTIPATSIANYLPEANIHAKYQQRLRNVGGTAPIKWSLSATLPPGLQFDPTTGTLSGTPTEVGRFTFQVKAVDAVGRSTAEQMSIRVVDDYILETTGVLDNVGSPSTPMDMALDAGGNSIVVGYIEDPMTGYWSTVLKKYDPSGNLLWSRLRSNDIAGRSEMPTGVAVDSTGAIYVSESYRFDTSDPSVDIFIAKYDSAGNVLWTKTIDDGAAEFPEKITVDSNDNLIITGKKVSPPTLIPVPDDPNFVYVLDNSEALTLKIDPAGELLWKHAYRSGTLMDGGRSVATDANGNIFVTGYTSYVSEMNSGWAAYAYRMQTLKYDPTGSLLWAKVETDESIYMRGSAIAVDKAGNSYVGTEWSVTSLYKYDPSGTLQWVKSLTPTPFVYNMQTDTNNNLLTVGIHANETTGGWVYYLNKFDTSGNILWTKDLDGSYAAIQISLDIDTTNNISVTRPYKGGFLNSTFKNLFSITSPSTLYGIKGIPYNQQLIANGGTAPYNWTLINGSLPAGLSLNPNTGVISGTPTATGTSTFTLSVKDTSNAGCSKSVSMSIYNQLNVTTTKLAGGTTDTKYSQTLNATGGKSPYSWSIDNGVLPDGLTLNSLTGTISGIPTTTAPGFSVRVNDSVGNTAVKSFTISVNAGTLTVVTTNMTDGYDGSNYTQTLAAKGGLSPFNWTISSGSLPPGLSLDPTTGIISGVPAASGSKTFTIMVTDSVAKTARKTLTLSVYNLPSITTTSLQNGATGASYTQTAAAAGGKKPYSWRIIDGTLPAGLNLNANSGLINGTPTTAGTTNFILQVADANGITASGVISITIEAAISRLNSWANTYSAAPNKTIATDTTAGSISVGSGSNRLLLVAVIMETGSAASPTISATYGGTALTQLAVTNGQKETVWIGYLKESQIGSGAKAITISYSGATGNATSIHVKWAAFSNVNQATPFASFAATSAAVTSVNFPSDISYVTNGMTTVVAGNGGSPATGALCATPAFTVGTASTTNGQTSNTFTSAKHTAAGNYSTSTKVSWSGNASAWSALVVLTLQP